MQLKKLDSVLLIVFPALAATISLVFKANFFISTLLFFIPLAGWLSFRTPKMINKAALFSLVSVPLILILDYLAIFNKSWDVATIFAFRIFGLVPLEDVIWALLLVYTVIIFYEHFFNKGTPELMNAKMRYPIFIFIALFLSFITIIYTKPELLHFRRFYFWSGLFVILLPAATFLSFFPGMISKYVKTGSYFFAFSMVVELTGLQLGHWEFTGTDFIGTINILGHNVPIEELMYFVTLFAVSLLAYYEFFDDDRK